MKYSTLCILHRNKEILLAMKKRGFGVGRWNGVGGKVGPDESIEDAVIRETEEEIGVRIEPGDLNKVAILHFNFINKPEWDQETHVYYISTWTGEPTESEEMKPQWYLETEIPFHSMWEDDPHWLPRIIKGEKVRGKFTFDENQKLQDGFTVSRLVE
jgi:8-oxo-dGTP pyrophosphatase MutT (NUDIX family)